MKCTVSFDGELVELERAWRVARARAGSLTRSGQEEAATQYAREARLLGTVRLVRNRIAQDEFTMHELAQLRVYLNSLLYGATNDPMCVPGAIEE